MLCTILSTKKQQQQQQQQKHTNLSNISTTKNSQ